MPIHNWTDSKKRTLLILRRFGTGTFAHHATAMSDLYTDYFTSAELSAQHSAFKRNPSPTSLFKTIESLSPDDQLVTETLTRCSIAAKEPPKERKTDHRLFSRSQTRLYTDEMDRFIWILRTTADQSYSQRTWDEITRIMNAVFPGGTEFIKSGVSNRHKSLAQLPNFPHDDEFWPSVLALGPGDEMTRQVMEQAAYHTIEGVSYIFSEKEDQYLCFARQRFSVKRYVEVKDRWERAKGLSTTLLDGRVWKLREGLVEEGREGVWARMGKWTWDEFRDWLRGW